MDTSQAMIPRALRTADARRPSAVHPSNPRVSWVTERESSHRQAAYRVRCSTNPTTFRPSARCVRATGWVASSRSTLVELPWRLAVAQRYYWRVQVRDEDGTVSRWSDRTWFETGPDDDWQADWIAAPTSAADAVEPAPALRTTVDITDQVARARLHVTGVGSYVPFLDGERIGDHELDPAFTNYDERVLYATHDLTADLDPGTHVLGCLLGRGRYACPTETAWAWRSASWHSDRPALRAQLTITYRDGTREEVCTDGSWWTAPTATEFDCLFAGERYDARLERDNWSLPGPDVPASAGRWSRAEVVEGPDGDMVPQRLQPMRVVDTVVPGDVTETDAGTYVFDLGEMVAGRVELSGTAPEGTRITLTHGECLDDDGHADLTQGHVDATLQTDEYVFAGTGTESWAPSFSYKGFRYVEVSGLATAPGPEFLTAHVINTDVGHHPQGGGAPESADPDHGSAFACSDSLLSRIHGNCHRSLLSNLHGIPTDTPTYEKNGWTGDAQLAAEATIYNFDVGRFYRKWLDDCADAQRPDGELPCIVPTSGWGYDDSALGGITGPLPAWDCAYVLIPWWLYRYDGDEQVLRTHYEGMKRLVEYLGRHATDSVLTCGLGDWVPPGAGNTFETMQPPEGPAITSTAYYYRASRVLAETARVLGDEDEATAFDRRAASIRTAFDDAFHDRAAGVYTTAVTDEYRQTSNIVPLAMGLVPDGRVEDVVSSVVADVERRNGHLNTGIVGTKYVLPTLTRHGHVDTAYRIATRRDPPGWGHWIEEGATSLYEAWDPPVRSRNHRMFATIEDWFYGWLAGIRPADLGFERVHIDPHHPTGLDHASATVETVRGRVACAWQRTEAGYRYDVTVPPNAVASVELGDGVDSVARRSVDGQPVPRERVRSTTDGGPGDGPIELGSGDWVLTSE